MSKVYVKVMGRASVQEVPTGTVGTARLKARVPAIYLARVNGEDQENKFELEDGDFITFREPLK